MFKELKARLSSGYLAVFSACQIHLLKHRRASFISCANAALMSKCAMWCTGIYQHDPH